jgi:6-carboxyhexanoate--CoA ligase
MRASKSVDSRKDGQQSVHISGAEGLYKAHQVQKILSDYVLRAVSHPRGMPDTVVITVEKMRQQHLKIPLLPLLTVQCNSPLEARKVLRTFLSHSGVSEKAMRSGMKIVTGSKAMRGASLMRAESGIRVEPDKARGVRVSRLGIEKTCEKGMSRRLARQGINISTVKEAIVLASKVASCEGVLAELCVSDDPHYTTGYVASRTFGYIRIPHIKRQGSMCGGRVFFIEEKSDVEGITEYLEQMPTLAESYQ